MIDTTGDLWTVPADARCITTNGQWRKNGRAIMGGGCAREAVEKNPGIDEILGNLLQVSGNHVYKLGADSTGALLFSFPTKEEIWNPSKVDLIRQSAYELRDLVDNFYEDLDCIVIPRPGAGLGGLDYEKEVRPVLEPILDYRFEIITFV